MPRNPSPPDDRPLNLSDAERAAFQQRVIRAHPDECWEWSGTRLRSGHGQFYSRERRCVMMASRVAMELDGKGPPNGLFACHSCDNPPCVNPSHLRWDTPHANSTDAKVRHRMASGERHGCAKLTDTQTVEFVTRYLRGEPSHTIQNVVKPAQIRVLASRYRRGVMPERLRTLIDVSLKA